MTTFVDLIGIAVAGGVGSYFGSYLKEKGKNLATHEDLDNLVTQVKAVTETTKQIESRISEELWDRQRRWEFKRDQILTVAQRLSGTRDALIELQTRATRAQTAETSVNLGLLVEAATAVNTALSGLEQSLITAALIVGNPLMEVLRQFNVFARNLSLKFMSYQKHDLTFPTEELGHRLTAVTKAMKEELQANEPSQK